VEGVFHGDLAGDDLVDLVGDESVRLAVHRVGRLRVGSVDEAEDLAVGLVHPVVLVVDAVVALDREVRLVGLGDICGVDRSVHVVHIHVQRHARHSPWSGCADHTRITRIRRLVVTRQMSFSSPGRRTL
jgi:hypothetical protein